MGVQRYHLAHRLPVARDDVAGYGNEMTVLGSVPKGGHVAVVRGIDPDVGFAGANMKIDRRTISAPFPVVGDPLLVHSPDNRSKRCSTS